MSLDESTDASQSDEDAPAVQPTLGERAREVVASGRLPFLNRQFLAVVGVALVLGAAAVLIGAYVVPPEVIDGMETPVRMDSFDRGIASDELNSSPDSKKSMNPFYEPTRWSIYGGLWGINGGQASIEDIDEDTPALAAMGWATPISSVQARLTSPQVNAGVAFRIASLDDFWAVVADPREGRQQLRILRVVNGEAELVGTTQKESMNVFGATLVTIRFEDDGFSIWVDGSISTRVRDDTFADANQSAGLVGVDRQARGARFDDFALFAEPTVRQLQPESVDPGAPDGAVTSTPSGGPTGGAPAAPGGATPQVSVPGPADGGQLGGDAGAGAATTVASPTTAVPSTQLGAGGP
ncbi:MAG: hypothetical protein R2754_02115 [Microthrixaceae bacterium]